jgi:hypothetical protein
MSKIRFPFDRSEMTFACTVLIEDLQINPQRFLWLLAN